MAIDRNLETENYDNKYAVADTFGDDFDVNARPAQATSAAPTSVGTGWEDAEKMTSSTGDYPSEFKHSEEIQVIKFLDANGPFATYKMHFLSQKVGKKSYVCLGAQCPLCVKLGHKPEDKRSFTIVNLSTDPFTRQILTATPRLYKSLHAAHFSPQGPLDKNFWALSRSGKQQTTTYHLNAVKGRDLKEDWNIDEAAATALIADTQPYDRSVIRENSYAELLEIATDLSS